MTQEELDKLVASVTPERLRTLALTTWGTFQHRGYTAVPVLALVEGLMAGMDTGDGTEKRQVMLRLRHAILATVQQMPGATQFPGS
jgi:hypothetical protein